MLKMRRWMVLLSFWSSALHLEKPKVSMENNLTNIHLFFGWDFRANLRMPRPDFCSPCLNKDRGNPKIVMSSTKMHVKPPQNRPFKCQFHRWWWTIINSPKLYPSMINSPFVVAVCWMFQASLAYAAGAASGLRPLGCWLDIGII
jgi:hypothetical protein